MVKTPKDKMDADPSDYDNLVEFITDTMDAGYTIEAEDFEGEQCGRCGETVPFEEVQQNPDALVTWDVQLRDTPDRYARYYFCSEECKKEAKRAIMNGEEGATPYADGHEELTEDQRRGFV